MSESKTAETTESKIITELLDACRIALSKNPDDSDCCRFCLEGECMGKEECAAYVKNVLTDAIDYAEENM